MQQIKSFWKEVFSVVVLSIIIVLPIRMYIASPFVVSGKSMDHTFADGNYLVVDEISYRFEEPKRGEIIVFKVPPKALENSNILSKNVYFIKRVIGLPGETVEIKGDQVKIYNEKNPEGLLLNEPYTFIDKLSPYYRNINMTATLKADEYFMMGDNRHDSSDSRYWGPITKESMKGRVFLRLFPFNKISVFTGSYSNY